MGWSGNRLRLAFSVGRETQTVEHVFLVNKGLKVNDSPAKIGV